ncbi:MAG: glycosyltransferase [Bryobacteraceae bacterium]
MSRLLRILRVLPLVVAAPVLVLLAAVSLAAADLFWLLRRRRPLTPESRPDTRAASVVIPTWNGRHLLEQYLPSVVEALAGNPANEIIVVDNASSDGTAEYVRDRFPSVRILELPVNLGFGGGSNAGFRQARNDIVVLLNNDMRVEPDFLRPLLEGFTDEKVFSVSCQIFFSDPSRRREETGLSQGWWENGGLRVGHRIDEEIRDLYPCFYGGGGSTAYDRRKFLELGGFDPLLAPFYLEDTDLGYLAWKRGWKVLCQPRSIVYHEHRGTIGRCFSEQQIRDVLAKNFLLWTWKNIHEWRRLLGHFVFTLIGAWLGEFLGEAPQRPTLRGLWRACLQLPGAVRSRLRARSLAVITDKEAFRRPLGGYFRDRFVPAPAEPNPLRVLFVSPYPILPPVHGGAVFMLQTLRELARLCEVHLIALMHYPDEGAAHEKLRSLCASAEFPLKINPHRRAPASVIPHAVREFAHQDLEWLIHRQIYSRQIDVVQLEYTPLAQYACEFRQLLSALFEHDVYFQSVARSIPHLLGWTAKLQAIWEYLRALYYETRVLGHFDQIQVCTEANREYLMSYVPSLASKIQAGLRAGIDVPSYPFQEGGREPQTMLFVGSFRHLPNQAALRWFTSEVLPAVRSAEPSARLIIAGSDPPPPHAFPSLEGIELLGAVEDIRDVLGRYAVFVCPVLSGSGVRVKLLEAFACGIPAVSTRLGAEGLTSLDGEICALAETPGEFAARILRLFRDPELALQLARRARVHVEQHWNIAAMTGRLVDSYRQAVRAKRAKAIS